MTNERLALKDSPSGQALLLATMAMLVLGVVMVHSAVASVADAGAWYARKDVRHTLFAAMALLTLCTFWKIDYHCLAWRCRSFLPSVPLVSALALLGSMAAAVLVFVPGLGREVGGFHRWIRIGPAEYGIGFQPSEMMKLFLPVFLAAWLSQESTKVRSFWRTFVPLLALIAVGVGLVMKDDFGTALVIIASAGTVLLLAGVPWYYLGGLLAAAAAGFYGLLMASPHRLARIQAMFEPWALANPTSFQPRQSLMAILTGGFAGKGLGCGVIKQGFLPEGETDFIFAVFFEECGVVGAALLVGLVLLWIWLVRRAAVRCDDPFGRLLVGSLGFMIALQAVLHIAVDVVAVPPTGITLPFISAGGTSLVISALAVAMIISVIVRGRPAKARLPAQPQPA